MIAARKQPQALRRLVDQLGLRQDAAADRHHGVGGQDEGAVYVVVDPNSGQRRRGLGVSQPVGAYARQLARKWCLVEIGGAEGAVLEARPVDEGNTGRWVVGAGAQTAVER